MSFKFAGQTFLHRLLATRACWGFLFLAPFFQPRGDAQAPFQKIVSDPAGRFLVAHDVEDAGINGHLITGEYRDSFSRAFLLSTDQSGNPKWAKTYRPADQSFDFPVAWAVTPTEDGGALMSGWKDKNTILQGQMLLKTNGAGEPQWSLFAPLELGETGVLSFDQRNYYGGYLFGPEKFFLAGIEPGGQPAWENLYTTGLFDYYTIFSINRLKSSVVVSLGVEQKVAGGGALGPDHSVLLKLNRDGGVEHARYFEKVFISGLQPLANGDLAFLAASDGIDWVGIGVMDSLFNWKWFKELRFKKGILLKNISHNQMAVSGNDSRLNGLFYVAEGGRILVRFDAGGNFLGWQLYLPGAFEESVCASGEQDLLRVSNLSSERFVYARPNPDGSLPDCPPRYPCDLYWVDTMFTGVPIAVGSFHYSLLKPEPVTGSDLGVSVEDWCFDPGKITAAFDLTDTLVCAGDLLDAERLFGQKDVKYGISDWLFQGGFPGSGSTGRIEHIRYQAPGSYPVRHILNVAGCVDTATLMVRVSSPTGVELGPDTLLCVGDSLLLRAGPDNPQFGYLWNTGENTASIRVHESGRYGVEVLDTAGCLVRDSMFLSVLSPEIVDLGPDTSFCNGERLHIGPVSGADPALQYQWNTGIKEPYLEIAEAGLYTLAVRNGACEFIDTLSAAAHDCPACRIFAPNIFAPESGGDNRIFSLYSDCVFEKMRLRVYDRWGNLVFQGAGHDAAWDGRANGRPALPGVYVFEVEMDMLSTSGRNETRRISGGFNLIR